MQIYKYNYIDIAQKSDQDFNGIILLTYAIVIGYNNRVSWGSKSLLKQLNLEYIPQILISKGLIKISKSHGIISKYKNNLPQSYFKNSWFLNYGLTPSTKAAYIYMLSQRRIGDLHNYIPESYVPENLWNNKLVERRDGNIYFMPEIAYQKYLLKISNRHT